MAISGQKDLGKRVCESLKLDPKKTVQIDFSVTTEPGIYVTVTQLMKVEELDEILPIMEEYKLVKTDKTSEISGDEDNVRTMEECNHPYKYVVNGHGTCPDFCKLCKQFIYKD